MTAAPIASASRSASSPADAARPITLALGDGSSVSGLVQSPAAGPAAIEAGCVLAHGAGAGMTHSFMAAVADGLAARGIASLRYQFPYMEAGKRRPDVPPVAHAAVRAAVAKAAELFPKLPLFAGGKSFGARMTSQAEAIDALPQVRGLVFIGFPLHPAGKPSVTRADHLQGIEKPMLFLQGTQDKLATAEPLRTVLEALGPKATCKPFAEADHSFHVPKRSGQTDDEVLSLLLDAMAEWMSSVRIGRNA
ncbi:putative hydrolase of the alpha/beta-hydrolase fold [Burkholderiales bacterium 8X]|nr:putative hydrolase of the alpha/beta-hydrolase fold [Burkholderiales bacterium 8X]